jgi:hypothetical protein
MYNYVQSIIILIIHFRFYFIKNQNTATNNLLRWASLPLMRLKFTC